MNAPLEPNGPIDPDCDATTPVDPRVAEAADAATSRS